MRKKYLTVGFHRTTTSTSTVYFVIIVLECNSVFLCVYLGYIAGNTER